MLWLPFILLSFTVLFWFIMIFTLNMFGAFSLESNVKVFQPDEIVFVSSNDVMNHNHHLAPLRVFPHGFFISLKY